MSAIIEGNHPRLTLAYHRPSYFVREKQYTHVTFAKWRYYTLHSRRRVLTHSQENMDIGQVKIEKVKCLKNNSIEIQKQITTVGWFISLY